MDDSLIVDLYWERSEQSVKETDNKYGSFCKTISFNILKNINDVDECLNDTYFQAWNAMPNARPKFLNAFLARIIRNLSLNRYKSKHTQKRGGEVEHLVEELEQCTNGLNETELAFDAKQTAKLLDCFLESLDEVSCVFFMRRYFYADSIS